ncbi:uncharacterized protein LOC128043012 [Gossypium raimondii]|uniref:uncharacterized protein LOC128043012 n=1 Tax=Gossypium raimondii TaxID=29730 RepID=UPI00227B6DCC|nr:uncharacterized protein LOC128043012 [Gossypium raimondii]
MYVETAKANTQESNAWKLNFDGASNAVGNGIGAVLVSPDGDHYPFTSKLDFDYTNNMAEYEACIMGIRAAIEHKIKLKGEWETRDPKLISYQRLVLELIEEFDDVTFFYLPRDENQMADALATLASIIKATENNKRTLRRLAIDYVLDGEILYRKGKDQMLLRCVDSVEAKQILEEVHDGVCGTHANGFTMGMDVIGPISPKASNGHRFIFVVSDYFTKWVEATSYASIMKSAVSKFLKKEIICRYGIPERIIFDNALNLNNSTIAEVCSQFKIKHHNSSPYRQKMNGAVEVANKNIKKIVGKMTETYRDWHEKLPFALYAYRTSVRTSTGATPFSLVYGMEAVLPIEVEIPSLRVLSKLKLGEAEWVKF